MILKVFNMLKQLRTWLQKRLVVGFWFPCFQTAIDLAYNYLSLAQCFNRWLTDGRKVSRGASEFYQFVLVIIGIFWVTFIDSPVHPVFTNRFFRFVGCVIALYLVTELFLFSLHWTFVATGKLHSVRRSLAGFLVNLFELALYFSIIFNLAGCQKNYTKGWNAVYENLNSVFNLELVAVREIAVCRIAAHYETVIAATLLVIVIASLVGAVVRPDERSV
jgi:hypothetical protein